MKFSPDFDLQWQVGQQLGEEMSVIIAGDSKIKRHFVSWLAGECRTVSRKRNRLALSESFLLKAGGCSRSSGKILDPPSVRYNYLELTVCRSVTPPSTLYRNLLAWAGEAREALRILFASDRSARLHWVDNYAKSYASRSM